MAAVKRPTAEDATSTPLRVKDAASRRRAPFADEATLSSLLGVVVRIDVTLQAGKEPPAPPAEDARRAAGRHVHGRAQGSLRRRHGRFEQVVALGAPAELEGDGVLSKAASNVKVSVICDDDLQAS